MGGCGGCEKGAAGANASRDTPACATATPACCSLPTARCVRPLLHGAPARARNLRPLQPLTNPCSVPAFPTPSSPAQPATSAPRQTLRLLRHEVHSTAPVCLRDPADPFLDRLTLGARLQGMLQAPGSVPVYEALPCALWSDPRQAIGEFFVEATPGMHFQQTWCVRWRGRAAGGEGRRV